MIEKVTIGDCELYHGDSMKIMPDLIKKNTKADLIVCDPPYLLTSGGNNDELSGALSRHNYNNDGKIVECNVDWIDFMPLFYDLLDRGHAYVMTNNKNIHAMMNASRWPSGETNTIAEALFELVKSACDPNDKRAMMLKLRDALDKKTDGFKFHNLLVWDKVTATPGQFYMKNCEFTGLFYKGKAKRINECGSMSGIRYAHRDESQSNHPTEKPVSLMEYYIKNSSKPGELVIDPFMGSGSTGVACVRTDRKFIGIESDINHFNECVRRCQHAYDTHQKQLF